MKEKASRRNKVTAARVSIKFENEKCDIMIVLDPRV
jgi:hypothetical protein